MTQSLKIKESQPVGRPTLYNEDIPDQVNRLCLLGLKDTEICTALGISERTLNVWKQTYPELMQSMIEGREFADGNVAKSLYKNATEKEDTRAQEIWLRNRQRAKWSNDDKNQGVTVNISLNDQPVTIQGEVIEHD